METVVIGHTESFGLPKSYTFGNPVFDWSEDTWKEYAKLVYVYNWIVHIMAMVTDIRSVRYDEI